MILVLFGLPGTGKTYVGKIFEESFEFFLYDADMDIPLPMKRVLLASLTISDTSRDEFFENVYERIRQLTKKYNHLTVAQTFIKEKYRTKLLTFFPDAKFILVQTQTQLREKRLDTRKLFPLRKEYAKKMSSMFEVPIIKHWIIDNNKEGKTSIITQGEQLLKQLALDKKT